MSYAQLLDVGLMCNGHDANKIMDMRTGTAKSLGLLAPAAAPTSAENGAGNVNGTVKYRVRWKDSSTKSYSLASPVLTVTTSSKKITVTKPATNETRATHWCIERTVDNGSTYYPINEISTATLDGTLIATTTFDDDELDSNTRTRIIYQSNQGQPSSYPIAWANGNVLFMAGGRVHSFAGTINNGADALSSTDGDFVSDMVGQDFSVNGDTDGVTYKIKTVTDADNIVLNSVYAGGANRSAVTCSIAGVRNEVAWCVPGKPDSWGSTEVGGLSNSVLIGADGDALMAGIGLGSQGCLLCSSDHMWLWSYRSSPQAVSLGGDGRIVPMKSRRGAFGPRSVYRFGSRIYGMDQYGVWAASVGGEPQEIGDEIAKDWRSLDMSQRGNFWIGPDPLYRQLNFFVCQSGDTYPSIAYVYDIPKNKWVGTKTFPWAEVPCGVALPDTTLALRLGYFTEAKGSAKSYFWFDSIGTTMGSPPSNTLTGTLDGTPSSTTITDSTAAFVTTGEGCDGCPVTLVRASDSSEETQVVVSNTGTVLTTNTFAGAAPVAGDTYHLGPVNAVWKTGRLHFGDPSRKKHVKGLWVWLKNDTGAVSLKLKAYYNGSATAAVYGTTRAAEDGVSYTAAAAPASINPGATNSQSEAIYRYWVDCPGEHWCTDVQFELYSIASGTAWEILDVKADVEFDQSTIPAKD